jgi:hypothetical protein
MTVTLSARTRPQGTHAPVDGHDGGHVDVGDPQDLVGLVGRPPDLAQGGDEQVAAVPDHPIPYRHHRLARGRPPPGGLCQRALVLVVVVEVAEQGLEVSVAEGPDGHARLLVVAERPAAVRVRIGLGGVGPGHGGLLELLAGGPLGATPACWRLLWGAGVVGLAAVKGCWPGGCCPLLTVSGALPLLDPLGGGAGLLPGGPLGSLAWHRAERLLGVAEVVAVAIILDGGGRLPPRPPSPGALGHRAELLAEVAGWVVLGDQAGDAALPSQLPYDSAVGGTEVGVRLQPPGPALLVPSQRQLGLGGSVGLPAGHHHRAPSGIGRPAQAKHPRALPLGVVGPGGELLSSDEFRVERRANGDASSVMQSR